MGSEKRQKTVIVKVRLSPEERESLVELGAQCQKSVPELLRAGGLGIRVKSVVDHKAVLALLKVDADLRRLGGLLKLWLSDDESLGRGDVSARQVRDLLNELNAAQRELRQRIENLC